MHQNNLANVDLNLLKVLDEIARQGSVTGAASALGLGQPAVSQALSRLRRTFKDDLFVRSPKGMAPTPKMAELIGPIRTALGQIEQTVFGAQNFDPDTTTDRMAHTLPKATLSLRSANRANAEDLLLNGDIDIALGLFRQKTNWIAQRRLYRENHICVYNADFLDLPQTLTVKDYVAHDHLLVSLDGSSQGFVDDILSKSGYTRRVVVTTPFFLQASFLLERLPLIATLPERFIQESSSLSQMETRKLPFETPGFYVSAAWRMGDERNPRIATLRDIVVEAAKSLKT